MRQIYVKADSCLFSAGNTEARVNDYVREGVLEWQFNDIPVE
jgi:hypothetical protein